MLPITTVGIDALLSIIKTYVEETVMNRIEKELQPLREQMSKKVEQIYEEEVAKFSVNFFEQIHIDKVDKNLVITIRKEK